MKFYKLFKSGKYTFRALIPSSNALIEQRYDFYESLSYLKNLLKEEKLAEAKAFIKACFSRAWWFRSQNKVPLKDIITGGGYSISCYTNAYALACLQYAAEYLGKIISLGENEAGKILEFSEYEKELEMLFGS